MGVAIAFSKSKPLEREIYVIPPLCTGKGPETRAGLLIDIYCLATSRKDWYEAINVSLAEN